MYLVLNAKLTVDYTAQLPVENGFKHVVFDSLPNHYTNSGEEVRGYCIGKYGECQRQMRV
jgi:NADH-quinone oxidoreductase subunit G